jgi:hypothetical protein
VLVIGCAPGKLGSIGGASHPSGETCRDKAAGAAGYIIGGRDTSDHPAVGFLAVGGAATCTATLISPTRILTAAHCNVGATHFGLGPRDGAGARLVPLGRFTAHPSYNDTYADHDIAVVDLRSPISDIAPLPIATTAPRPGETVTLVGYGTNDGRTQMNSGVKRQVDVTVAGIEGTQWFYGAGSRHACYGDSGGPALRHGASGLEVMGVASTVMDDYCTAGGYHVRTDSYLSFLDVSGELPAPSGPLCEDTCAWAGDGECDDGGPGSLYAVCAFGSDCTDCGSRNASEEPPLPEEPPPDEPPPPDDPPPGGDVPDPDPLDAACTDACPWANDGVCDDGGPGSRYCVCALGSDCSDCGIRR